MGISPPRWRALVINRQGEMEGSVSGGCVEGAVVLEAIEALEKGAHMLLEYGISDGDAFAVGLACGGTIRFGEPIGDVMPVSLLEQLVEARKPPRRCLCCECENGGTRLCPTGMMRVSAWIVLDLKKIKRLSSAFTIPRCVW